MTFWLILWVVFLCVYYLLIYSFQSRSVFFSHGRPSRRGRVLVFFVWPWTWPWHSDLTYTM